MNILLDPTNKFAKEFLIYRKIQDGRLGSKVQNRPKLTPQITFWLGIWIPFIRFGQSLTWTYYLTLQTNLTDKFLHKLVCMVKKYVYVNFCPNLINEIQMLNQNVICRVKFGRFWTFDPQRPSWILG